jgi:hypothetical protein
MRHFPPLSDQDADVASDVARALVVSHVILPQRRSRVLAEIRKNRITNFCADEHAWFLPVADHVRGKVRHVYDGLAGDVLSAGLFLSPERLALFEAGRFEELAVKLFEYRERYVDGLLTPDWAARLGRDEAMARLVPELARHAGAPNPVGSFYFWNRTRREIALSPYRILSRSVEVQSPYLDHALYDFLASLPASLLMDHTLHSAAIGRAYPRYRDLRFEDKTFEPPPARGHFRRYAGELAAYALSGMLGRRPEALTRDPLIMVRALRHALDGDPERLEWLSPGLAIYLLQLSRLRESPLDGAVGS